MLTLELRWQWQIPEPDESDKDPTMIMLVNLGGPRKKNHLLLDPLLFGDYPESLP